jgi:hypothetical protein
MTIRKLLLVAVLSGSLFGQSAKEKALQAQLDAATAALAVEQQNAIRATEQQLALVEQLKRATAAGLARTAAGTVSEKNATGTAVAAAASAAVDAATSQAIALSNGQAAARAAEAAAQAANGVVNTARSQNVAVLITTSFGFLSLIVATLWKAYTDSRDRRWAKEDFTAHQKDVLEKLAQVKDEAHAGRSAADAAYKEANTVNLKIASIGMQLKDGTPAADSPPKTMTSGGGAA